MAENKGVTVVVLGREIPALLRQSLDAQTCTNFEVILADEPGIVPAMNSALARATGKYFVRIDTDVTVTPCWIEGIIAGFVPAHRYGVTGPTWVTPGRRKYRDSIRTMDPFGTTFNLYYPARRLRDAIKRRFITWLYDGLQFEMGFIVPCGAVSYGSNYQELMRGFHDRRFEGMVRSDYFLRLECRGARRHCEGTNWAVRTDDLRAVGGFDAGFTGSAEWFDDDALAKISRLAHYNTDMSCEDGISWSANCVVHHLLERDTLNFGRRYGDWSRVTNWLRYHRRHSSFSVKKIVYLGVLVWYTITQKGLKE